MYLLRNNLNFSALQNVPFCPAKRHVLACRTVCFAVPNGLYCKAVSAGVASRGDVVRIFRGSVRPSPFLLLQPVEGLRQGVFVHPHYRADFIVCFVSVSQYENY